jgi:hypothetical protein
MRAKALISCGCFGTAEAVPFVKGRFPIGNVSLLFLRGAYRKLLETAGAGAAEFHISRKTSEMPRISCTQRRTRLRCAFLQGKAHEARGTYETSQEIGDVGHPIYVVSLCCKDGR